LNLARWRSLGGIPTGDVDLAVVIVSLHVATGAALGALTRSRVAALALGPPLHLACDRVPHEDIDDRRFEIRSGVFAMALLAVSLGSALAGIGYIVLGRVQETIGLTHGILIGFSMVVPAALITLVVLLRGASARVQDSAAC